MPRLIFVFVGCFFIDFALSQSNPQLIAYRKLQSHKVDENRFEFGWLPDSYGKVPCFRDFTKNRIQVQLTDPKKDSIIYTSTKHEINGLKIIPDKIVLDKNNKLFQMNGQITGAWESVIPLEFEIYIGHRNDTVSDITVSPNLHWRVTYNGVKVDSTIVVDRVPAFYLTNFKKFNAYRGSKKLENSDYKEMIFDISCVIDEKTILIFGLSSRYAEIFEVGKLLNDRN